MYYLMYFLDSGSRVFFSGGRVRWKRKSRGEKGAKPSPATIIFF